MRIVTTQRVPQASEATPGRRQWRAAKLTLRLLVAAALAVDAYVHADLAPLYDAIHASVSQGDLFRVGAGVAAAGALVVRPSGRRAGCAVALLVAVGALGVILLYRYVDVGTLGP